MDPYNVYEVSMNEVQTSQSNSKLLKMSSKLKPIQILLCLQYYHH